MSLRFTRRQFISLSASLAALALTPNLQPVARKKSNGLPVIVIGAGAAGIYAARLLQNQGYTVKVLEGRDRFGGRVWTDRSWNNVALDMGASWIHGITGNPLSKLVQDYGIKTLPTDYGSHAVYDPTGKRFSEAQIQQSEQHYQDALSAIEASLQKRQENGQPDESIQVALDDYLAQAGLSSDVLLDLNYSVNTEIEHEYAADVNDLSVYNYNSAGQFPGGDVVFPDGYDQIISHLAEGLDIQLSQVVTAISHTDQGVTVRTDKNSFEAAYAVVTLPLGVLKAGTVQFDPVLPARKTQAIGKLGMGVLNKVYLRFPDVFWPEDIDLLGFMTAEKGYWAEWLNMYKVTKLPILLGFNAGAYGAAIETLTDAQIVAEAMKALRTMFGSAIPDADKWLITRYGLDPFARGSYSHTAPGATPDDYIALGESVADRLFFAGEATSADHGGTVHGALLSGERAASQIIARGRAQ